MSQDVSRNASGRREYWLRFGTFLEVSGVPIANEPFQVHVLEVLPGETTITREELQSAIGLAVKNCDEIKPFKTVGYWLEQILFFGGDLSEGQER